MQPPPLPPVEPLQVLGSEHLDDWGEEDELPEPIGLQLPVYRFMAPIETAETIPRSSDANRSIVIRAICFTVSLSSFNSLRPLISHLLETVREALRLTYVPS